MHNSVQFEVVLRGNEKPAAILVMSLLFHRSNLYAPWVVKYVWIMRELLKYFYEGNTKVEMADILARDPRANMKLVSNAASCSARTDKGKIPGCLSLTRHIETSLKTKMCKQCLLFTPNIPNSSQWRTYTIPVVRPPLNPNQLTKHFY